VPTYVIVQIVHYKIEMSVSVVADSAVADSNYNLKWPQLQQFFEQQGNIEDKNIEFKCVLCKPKHKILSTSSTSYSNLRAHIKVNLMLEYI